MNRFDLHIDPDDNYYSLIAQESCQYFTLDEFSVVPNNVDNCSILNYNIRSFNANGATFEAMLDSVETDYDCIIITETWNTAENLELCRLDGFSSSHTYRQNLRGGGVSVFCSNRITMSDIEFLSRSEESIESCAVEFVLGGMKIIIIGIYRPPTGNVIDFITILESMLNSIDLETSTVVISGDFNINLTDSEDRNTLQLSSALFSLHFFPIITKPTRFPPGNSDSTPTTIDHIWVNKICPNQSGIINFDVTDHLPCFYHFKIENFNNAVEVKRIETRPFSDQKLQNLIIKLTSIDWDSILDSSDIDACCTIFSDRINYDYKKCFPLKVKHISLKRLTKPCITSDVKRLINLKSEYFNMYRRGIISKQTNNLMKNRLTKEINRAKNSYFIEAFQHYKNDSKKSWKLLHQLTGMNKTKYEIMQLLDGDKLLTDKQEIANGLSTFFSNVALNLDDDLPTNDVSPYSNIQTNPRSFFIYPVTINECINIISTLKITKDCVNHIPVKIFILIKEYISYPLSKIINASFSSGIFPQKLKLSRIVPVFKQGDKYNPSNYRPISSLPYISKIYERCMTNRLISFFNKFSLFSNSQFGFRKRLSTYYDFRRSCGITCGKLEGGYNLTLISSGESKAKTLQL